MDLLSIAKEFLEAVKADLDPYTTTKNEIVELSETSVMLLTPSHIQFARYGRGPGKMPPVDVLEAWVTTKGIIFDGLTANGTAWAIARSISLRGTKNWVPNAPNAIQESLTKNYEAYKEHALDVFTAAITDEMSKFKPLPDISFRL